MSLEKSAEGEEESAECEKVGHSLIDLPYPEWQSKDSFVFAGEVLGGINIRAGKSYCTRYRQFFDRNLTSEDLNIPNDSTNPYPTAHNMIYV